MYQKAYDVKFDYYAYNANSTTTPTTSNPTTTPPSYQGTVSLAKPGEGPTDIWADKDDVYPKVLTVDIGTTVTFKDLDIVAFTVVADDGMFAGDMTAMVEHGVTLLIP